MTVAEIILRQLGGSKFIAMTGAKQLIAGENRLGMLLPKNASKANRLVIVLDADDTYTMRFYRFTAGRVNRKTLTYIEEKIEEVESVNGVYCDMLQDVFTKVTGMHTHL